MESLHAALVNAIMSSDIHKSLTKWSRDAIDEYLAGVKNGKDTFVDEIIFRTEVPEEGEIQPSRLSASHRQFDVSVTIGSSYEFFRNQHGKFQRITQKIQVSWAGYGRVDFAHSAKFIELLCNIQKALQDIELCKVTDVLVMTPEECAEAERKEELSRDAKIIKARLESDPSQLSHMRVGVNRFVKVTNCAITSGVFYVDLCNGKSYLVNVGDEIWSVTRQK